jgi:hypothetical protein
MKLVHGRARHPQSQGSVERANADIKKMLATWMRENRSVKWSIGCKFVQLQKNHTLHSALKCSPYKATFGIDTPLGLQSTIIPSAEWSKLETAKDLFGLVGHQPKMGDGIPDESEEELPEQVDKFNPDEYGITDLIPPIEVAVSTTTNVTIPTNLTTTSTSTAIAAAASTTDEVPIAVAATTSDEVAEYQRHSDRLLGIREKARLGQAKQAERMRGRSEAYLPDVAIGDFVTLHVNRVDLGLTDAPNLTCRIIDINWDTCLYELASGAGVLEVKYPRNAFDRQISELTVPVRTDVKVGVREAVKALSIGGGQGVFKCNCTKKCLTNLCKCKSNGVFCNSRCHGSNKICENK